MPTLRAVTLNLWGEQPPLARRMELAVEQLRALRPDVLALQEVRAIPGTLDNQADTLGAALGMHVHFAPATPWGGGIEGLAMLSRFPIVERYHRELPHAIVTERRVAVGVTVETPSGPFSAFTTHLNYRLADGAKREEQVFAVEELAAEVASELPKIILGDFNATPESDEIRYLRGLHSIRGKRVYWQDAYARSHPREDGFTWALRNPYTERLHFLDRDRRLDYIFVSPVRRDRRGTVEDCRIVLDQPAAEGAYPSDHFALLADIIIE
jgi:endonuclease/exonuclease/phosphatase family metal-dependent hydrolase